ncbi:uncharacterized protein DEA37_0011410 [Paragonimus westermani]|uniref:DMAP1-binding domain-containing protein n=1 Tax=Paragonimus westermani TaxID=34504 RepID=A0A5J4NGH4_9TREM|nr:uncharacterized protein DEA37_0011410 [Paragonimus westermani]
MDNLDPSDLPFEVRSKLAELELELSEVRCVQPNANLLFTGDITEKGYQKKKSKLLAPFFRSREGRSSPANSSPGSHTSGAHLPCGAVQLPGLSGNGFDHRLIQLRSVASSSSSDDTSETTDEQRPSPNVAEQDLAVVTATAAGPPPLRPQNRRYFREDNRYRSDIREEAVREALEKSRRQRLDALLPNKRRDNGRLSSGDVRCDAPITDDSEEDDLSSEASAALAPNQSADHSTVSSNSSELRLAPWESPL